MRRTGVGVGLVGSLLVLAAAPAGAQPSGETTVTFAVRTANLEVEVAPADYLGVAQPGETVGSRIGVVEVRDERAIARATWTATVVASASAPTTGPDDEIGAGRVRYWSGPAVSTAGHGRFVPGQPTADDAVPLDRPRTAFSKTSGNGTNSARWSPTVVVEIPPEAVRGTYTGTMTHSVA
jgi:hypothetical protein